MKLNIPKKFFNSFGFKIHQPGVVTEWTVAAFGVCYNGQRKEIYSCFAHLPFFFFFKICSSQTYPVSAPEYLTTPTNFHSNKYFYSFHHPLKDVGFSRPSRPPGNQTRKHYWILTQHINHSNLWNCDRPLINVLRITTR